MVGYENMKYNSNIFSHANIGHLRLRNRIIRSGCFEGMAFNGEVTGELVEHHKKVAAGGTAMTTVAYCSVSFDGRAFDQELWMRDEIVPGLRNLTDTVHKQGAAVSIQLNHCGFFSDRKVIGEKPVGASKKYCAYRMSWCKEMTEKQITEKIDDFGQAAVLAKKGGFDAIEIHAGHGYLISQFLSPWTNTRMDKYGGPLENRARFAIDVIRKVRASVGPGFPILIKMNLEDGFKGGLVLDEAVRAAVMFEREGVDALIPSCGFTSRTPWYMLRGKVPVRDMAKNQEKMFSRLGLLIIGRLMIREYPFESMFLLNAAKKIKGEVKVPVIYVGGVLSRNDIDTALQFGFDFVQVGRATVRDPDFVKRIESGEILGSDCDHCNRCIAAMYSGGVYCVSEEKGLISYPDRCDEN
jgi:2,4-dienoyl-CoA reductase-like NADH-dependent reductase (Old Yellow Enzyme family)